MNYHFEIKIHNNHKNKQFQAILISDKYYTIITA